MQDPKRFDSEGALWTEKMISKAKDKVMPWKLCRTVVAVDPAVTNEEDSDDTGIVAASSYTDTDFTVDDDQTIKASTDTWAQVVINTYEKHNADAVVVEVNNGGDLVENVLRLKGFKGRIINVHASKGKFARAEPISALYEQGKVKHKDGLYQLETEVMEYVPLTSKKSPNRLDALVWALTELSNPTRSAGTFDW
jgi:phage terminase large subunit-like protein